MNARFFFSVALAIVVCPVWAQQGGGAPARPQGGASFGVVPREDAEPRRHRAELRSLIREQRHPDATPDGVQGSEPAARQLSREEREALREQLRRQRHENWRREPG